MSSSTYNAGGTPAASSAQEFDISGRLVKSTDGTDNYTRFVYNGAGQVVEEFAYDPLDVLLTTRQRDYDLAGRLREMVDAEGNITRLIYNGLGQTVSTKIYKPNGTDLVYEHAAVYDSAGRLKETSDGVGNLVRYTYNGAGQVLTEKVYESDGVTLKSQITNVYDAAGRLITTTDGLGRVTDYTYNAAGLKTSETTAAGTSEEATTQFIYDTAGRLTEIIDPGDNSTTFVYNAAGNLLSSTDPLDNTEARTYDVAGRLDSLTDRKGRIREFAYDGAGRLTEDVWLDTDGTTVLDTYSYSFDVAGRMLSASNSVGEYTFVYDALGRVTSVTQPFGVSQTFGYDDNGNRTLVEDSFGGRVDSTYDAAHRLISRVYTATSQPTLRIDQEFSNAGQLLGQSRYSDAAGTQLIGTTDFDYDAAGRIKDLEHKNGSGTTLADYEFTYNAAGELTAQTDHGVTRNYTYDENGQLTGDGVGTYSYDEAGNRDMTGYQTGAANQLETDGNWTYTYDDAGNLRKKVANDGKTWTYGYDHRNQLAEARYWLSDPDNTNATLLSEADYKYDVFGNRVEKAVDWDGEGPDPAEVTRYAIDAWNPSKPAPIGNENSDVWAEIVDGSLTTRYIRGDVVDQLFARLDGNDAFWYLPDHLGTIRDVADASGAVVEALVYDGFGNLVTPTDPQFVGRYRFTGREFDVETGLQYNRARYYDGAIGRWITEDPLGFGAGDSNLYRYVNNRPTTATDPSGLMEGAHFHSPDHIKYRQHQAQLRSYPPTPPISFPSKSAWSTFPWPGESQAHFDARQALMKLPADPPVLVLYRESDNSPLIPIAALPKSRVPNEIASAGLSALDEDTLRGVFGSPRAANSHGDFAGRVLMGVTSATQLVLGVFAWKVPGGQGVGTYMMFRGADGLIGAIFGERPTTALVKAMAGERVAMGVETSLTIGDLLAGFTLPPFDRLASAGNTLMRTVAVGNTGRQVAIGAQVLGKARVTTETIANLRALGLSTTSIRLGGQIIFMAMNGDPRGGNQGGSEQSAGAPPSTISPRGINWIGVDAQVAEGQLERAIARLNGLLMGGNPAISELQAFGSRVGSTFRGAGHPSATSDIDVFVRGNPLLQGSRYQANVERRMLEIARDFEAATGIKLNLVPNWQLTRERAIELLGSGPVIRLR